MAAVAGHPNYIYIDVVRRRLLQRNNERGRNNSLLFDTFIGMLMCILSTQILSRATKDSDTTLPTL